MPNHLGFSVHLENIRGETPEPIMNVTDRIIPGTFKSNRAGVQFAIYMTAEQAARYIDRPQGYRVTVYRLAEPRHYRLSAPKSQSDRVYFQAAAVQSTLADSEYTRLWIQEGFKGWKAMPESELSTSIPTFYSIDQQDRLYAALKNNTTYDSAYHLVFYYELDIRDQHGINAIAFTLRYRMDVDATVEIVTYTRTPYTEVDILATHVLFGTTAGATPTESSLITFDATAAQVIGIRITPNTNPVTPYSTGTTNPEGTWFVEVKNMQIATSCADPIVLLTDDSHTDTAITSAASLGANALITVDDTSKLVAGLPVYVGVFGDQGAERTIVNSIVSATQFRADLIDNHSTSQRVRAIRVTEREIISDVIQDLTIQEYQPFRYPWPSGGLSFVLDTRKPIANAAWIESAGMDIMRDLATPHYYTYGVNPQAQPYFHPAGYFARQWLIDATEIEISRPIVGSQRSEFNRVRALFIDSAGKQQLTDPANDYAAQAAEGQIREHIITVDTTSLAVAEQARDLALLDTAARPIESAVKCSYIMNPIGCITAADSPQQGDVITVRNISAAWDDPSLTDIPIYEIEIEPETGLPSIVPQAPTPRLDRMLAAALPTTKQIELIRRG